MSIRTKNIDYRNVIKIIKSEFELKIKKTVYKSTKVELAKLYNIRVKSSFLRIKKD